MNSNIVAATEEAWFKQKPVRTLRQLGESRALNRRILSWSYCDGTYGMGGPGFFSLELEKKGGFPKEKFCACLWCAAQWLLLDDRWIEAHPNQYAKQKPLFGNSPELGKWDEVTNKLVGQQIVSIIAEGRRFEMRFSNGSTLRFPDNPETALPLHGGSLEPHIWNDADDWRDAWVYASGTLWTAE